MKKIITFIVLVISCAGMAQAVTITTDKTAAELINNVLVSSPCFIATGVTASTGSNFGSTKGIGYFSNINPSSDPLAPTPNNPLFPFTSGVVLTTGDVTKVPSPNNAVLSDGIASWPGDAEMQTALLSQGVNINSVNASSLQFDFIATTTTFSMSFIFASEEYGASQCNYSDAFAFLIKNLSVVGSTYQNLGTVPANAPPNTPITVATIRDALYNPSCSSVNPSFFGEYNGGGFGPAINFNGQTIPMTASAPLIVGNTYRVKLVIADGNNNVGYDSAIFLEAKTLNIGAEVLGIDYVIANASAPSPRSGICEGDLFPILQPQVALPAGTTYQWQKLTTGGTWSTVTNNNTSILNLNTTNVGNKPYAGQTTSYRLIYTRPGCEAITDEIDVQRFPAIDALASVPPLSKCQVPGSTPATIYNFVFGPTSAIILNNNTPLNPADDLANVTITFHSSEANANANIAITNIDITQNDGSGTGYNMYAKITSNTTGCSVIRNFKLLVVVPPVIVSPPLPLTLCAVAPAIVPRARFNLTDNINLIRGTIIQNPDYNVISFHNSQTGANTNSDVIIVNDIANVNFQSTTVYVRFQNLTNPDCFVTTSFTVTVTPLAYVDILPDVIVCDNFVLPTLTQVGATYWSLTGGASGGGTAYNAGDVITPNATTPTTIWVYNENGACQTNDSFRITKANLPAIAPASASVCQTDFYFLPNLSYGTYYMLAGGPNITGGNTTPPPTLFQTPGPKTIHVWFENTTETGCGQDYVFTITVIPFTLLPDYTDKFACSSYTLNTPAGNGANYFHGPGGSGGMITLPFTYSTADSQKTIYVYKQSNTTPTNCTDEKSFTIFIGLSGGGLTPPANVDSCSAYTLPNLGYAEYWSGPSGTGTPYPSGSIISATGTTKIYFWVPGQTCTGNLSFDVNIALPDLAPIPDVPSVCDEYTLPYIASHPNGKYWTGPLGTGTPYPNRAPGDPAGPSKIYTLGTQTIYFYEKAASGPCYVEKNFQLTINPSPQISQRPISVVTCNQSFVLDDLEFGEYYKFPDGPSPTNPVLPPLTSISANDTGLDYAEIWVYSSSTNLLNTCKQQYSIKIYLVNTTVNEIADVTACDSYTLPAIVGPGDYWTAAGGPLGTGSKITLPYTVNTTTTLHVYAEDNNRVACSDEDPFTVTIVKTPDLNPVTAKTVCDSYTLSSYNDPMFTFTATNPGTVTKIYKNPGGANANTLPGDEYTLPLFISNTNVDFSPLVVTLYPYTEALGTGVTCFDDEPFVVTINRTPVIVAAEVADVTACDTYTLPALTLGKYYSTAAHLPGDELTGTGLTLTNATNTVYVYAETGTTPNCAAGVESFVVTINKTPVFTPAEVADVFVCNSYTLPALSIPGAKYYTAPDGPNGTGTLIPDAQVYTSDVTVYAYAATGTTPNCSVTEDIVISIYNVIEALDVTVCDTYQLPVLADPNANYYTQPNKGGTLLPELSFINSSQTVYINGTYTPNSACSDESSFDVIIVPTPIINPIAPVTSCDIYNLPLFSDPMFTFAAANPGTITKFYKFAGGPANNTLPGDEYAEGFPFSNNSTTPLVVTVYAYAEAGSVPCYTDEPLVITINKSPVIVASEVVPVTACDSYTLPTLTIGNYFSNAAHTNPITNLTLTGTQTVYVYAENGLAPDVCSDSANFLVTINNTPQFTAAAVADVSTCNSYTLPVLSLAGAKYYTGNNATGTQILPGTIYTSDTTIFAYAETGTVPNCYVSESINIQIYNVIELADVTVCGSYTLPNLTDLNAGYYQFSGGVGPIPAGTTLLNSQTVYVNGTSPNATCTDESDFIVTINGQPIANDASDAVCDSDSSPYDGITPYDVTTLIPTILGTSQAPADFTVTFYSDFNRTVQIIDPTISTLPIVYVFVTNNLSPTCPSPATVTINVIPLPNPILDVPPICIDSETGIVTNSVIESGYNSLQYNIVWSKSDGTVVSNNQTFSTDVPGKYVLNVSSNTVTSCASGAVDFTIIESAKPAVTPPITFDIAGWFTNSQTITVNATPYVGNGDNFAYSLDGQTPQDGPGGNVFTNVGPGAHEITVIDKNGCGSRSLPIPVELVTSPPAFTPNGDGINDRWDIKGEISYTTLTIYDRFGRLLKQLTQNSGGWDGTINSQSLPADDYWFSLNYVDSSGASREYKSHFSLIR